MASVAAETGPVLSFHQVGGTYAKVESSIRHIVPEAAGRKSVEVAENAEVCFELCIYFCATLSIKNSSSRTAQRPTFFWGVLSGRPCAEGR